MLLVGDTKKFIFTSVGPVDLDQQCAYVHAVHVIEEGESGHTVGGDTQGRGG